VIRRETEKETLNSTADGGRKETQDTKGASGKRSTTSTGRGDGGESILAKETFVQSSVRLSEAISAMANACAHPVALHPVTSCTINKPKHLHVCSFGSMSQSACSIYMIGSSSGNNNSSSNNNQPASQLPTTNKQQQATALCPCKGKWR
jgi:hypothetical protein